MTPKRTPEQIASDGLLARGDVISMSPTHQSPHKHSFSYSLNDFNDFNDDELFSYNERDVLDANEDDVMSMVRTFVSASPQANQLPPRRSLKRTASKARALQSLRSSKSTTSLKYSTSPQPNTTASLPTAHSPSIPPSLIDYHNWHERMSPVEGVSYAPLPHLPSAHHYYPSPPSSSATQNSDPRNKSPLHPLSELSGLTPTHHLSPSRHSLDKSALYSDLFADDPQEQHADNTSHNAEYARSLLNLNQKSAKNREPADIHVPQLQIELENDEVEGFSREASGHTTGDFSNHKCPLGASPTLPESPRDAHFSNMSSSDDEDNFQNDVINTLSRNEWMDNWDTKSLELKKRRPGGSAVNYSPVTTLSPSHIARGRKRTQNPNNVKPAKKGTATLSSTVSSQDRHPMHIDDWRHRVQDSIQSTRGGTTSKSLLKRNLSSGSAIASTSGGNIHSKTQSPKKSLIQQPLTTDQLVTHLHQGDTVQQVLQSAHKHDTQVETHEQQLHTTQEPQFPRRHSQTFPTTEVVLPALAPDSSDSYSENLECQERIKELEKKYGVKEYRDKLRDTLVPVQKNGMVDYFALNFHAQQRKLKFQRPYVSRYEWKTRLYDEFSQFHLFANSISLHFPKNEDWKQVYKVAKRNDLSIFIFLFLSPKTPCSAISLLNHVSKVVEYEQYAQYLDNSSTQLRRTTHLNPNGTLKKNCIPPHSQYLVRFLHACQNKHTTLLMNNMMLKEVQHILMKDIGERNIKYLIDDESKIRVFAWLTKQQHKLFFLVSPTVTLYLPCFYSDRKVGSFDFRFSWVLTNNHLLNLGRGRIRGAVGLLGGEGALGTGSSETDSASRRNSSSQADDDESQRVVGSRGSSRRGKVNLLSRENIFQKEPTFGAPERIQLTNIRSNSMKNVFEEEEDTENGVL